MIVARSGKGGSEKDPAFKIHEDASAGRGGGGGGTLQPPSRDVQRENDNGANIRNNHPAQDGSGGGRENRAPP